MDMKAFEEKMKKLPEVSRLYDRFLEDTGLDLFAVFRMYLTFGEEAVTELINKRLRERLLINVETELQKQIKDLQFFNNLPIEMRKQAIIAMQTGSYSA